MYDEPNSVFSLARPVPFLYAGLFSHLHVSSRKRHSINYDQLTSHRSTYGLLNQFLLTYY